MFRFSNFGRATGFRFTFAETFDPRPPAFAVAVEVAARGEEHLGAHQELLVFGGLYADLHQRQLLEEELAAV